ncbi:TonB-dependent siderophore receptor [Leucothrix sargassi]|nr:TonB-dependent siderophore receptor [Leucothrix sargassi]
MLHKKVITSAAIGLLFGSPSLVHAADNNDSTTESDAVTELGAVTVTELRENRVSTGATGLELAIKETPQSITVLEQESMVEHGADSSNAALEMVTGINVQQYETNRATLNSRGYDIPVTQIDGVATTLDYAQIVGELDNATLEKIEVVRGANGLLTSVGNSSGTVNYIRKRPTNKDEGEVSLSAGSYDKVRGSLDYNKLLSSDGNWAGRVVIAREEKDSHIRDNHNERTTLYGVIDGQVGEKGVFTLGLSYNKNDQDSPTWGAIPLNYTNGGFADFSTSTSTSADWTYWDTETKNIFAEYLHNFNDRWEGKVSYNWTQYDEEYNLLYAYLSNGVGLNDDNTGLTSYPYKGYVEKTTQTLDANVKGEFDAFGQTHNVIVGISHEDDSSTTFEAPFVANGFLPYPALDEYDGDYFEEAVFGEKTENGGGEKELTRLYAASVFSLGAKTNATVGLNAIRLAREGGTTYGGITLGYPVLKETSPYFGLTYDITPNTLAYASYSDIFQNQDQTDVDGVFLDPMKGVNYEVGVKSELFDKKLLATAAVFKNEQQGLAVYGGVNDDGQNYYVGKDVNSEGFEIELSGKVTDNTNLAVGVTHLKLTDPDGEDTSQWIPRTTAKVRVDTRLPQNPKFKVGASARWQSDVTDESAEQDAYMVTNAFASYDVSKNASLRLNVNNIFDEKYIANVQHGAIYGAPRNAALTFNYKF